jgi:hypothetical protein
MPVVVIPYILNVWLLLVDHRMECCVIMLCSMVRCVVHNNACCGFSVYVLNVWWLLVDHGMEYCLFVYVVKDG